jgi:hypothetical protein
MDYYDFRSLVDKIRGLWAPMPFSHEKADLLQKKIMSAKYEDALARAEQLSAKNKYIPPIDDFCIGLFKEETGDLPILKKAIKATIEKAVKDCPDCKGIMRRKAQLSEYEGEFDESDREFWEKTIAQGNVTGCRKCLPVCHKCKDKGTIDGQFCNCIFGKTESLQRSGEK